MLVLTRGKGERVVIGEQAEIVLHVIEIRGNQVRLGVQAPKDVPVHRHEVHDRIHSTQDKSAAKISTKAKQKEKEKV